VVFLLYTDFSTEAAAIVLALQKQQLPWRLDCIIQQDNKCVVPGAGLILAHYISYKM
jgi:hypothetical protein